MNNDENSNLARLSKHQAQKAARMIPKAPSMKVNLMDQMVPPHHKSFQFYVGPDLTDSESKGWTDASGGLDLTVRSMLESGHMPAPKSILSLAGSTPTKSDVAPSVQVGEAIGGLPEMAALCLRIDAAKTQENRGTWVLLNVSQDDHALLTRAMLEQEDNLSLKNRFEEAMAAAYNAAHESAGKHRPVALIWDDNGLPVLIKLSDTAAIIIANTGIAGGGKDTANLSTRHVTGPRGTVAHLKQVTSISDAARSAVNGVVSHVASHGSTSKDVLVKEATSGSVDSHPFSGSWTWMMGSDFSEFPTERRAHVAMELLSSMALTLYQPKDSGLSGGQHTVFCDNSTGGEKTMHLNMAEIQLIHHDRKGPTDQDRTDIRATVGGWVRDLGSGLEHTRLRIPGYPEKGYMPQGHEAWVASGASVSYESLERLSRSPESDQDLRGIMQEAFSRSFSQFSTGMTVDFNPRDVANARRCVKAMLVKIHIPESQFDNMSSNHVNALKAGALNTAQRMFNDASAKMKLPSLECVIYSVPDGLTPMPHLSLLSLTHGVDLIRLVMMENQTQLNHMTPYHYTSISGTENERSRSTQLARQRLDAMVKAIRSQPSEPVLQTWSDALQLIRSSFFKGGYGEGKVRMDPKAMDKKSE